MKTNDGRSPLIKPHMARIERAPLRIEPDKIEIWCLFDHEE